MNALLPCLVLALSGVEPSPPASSPPPPGVAQPAPAAGQLEPEPPAKADEPEAAPLSTYDRVRQGAQSVPAVEEGPSWGTQLLRTLFALGVVVGLIYLFFKVGLVRLMGIAAVRGGKAIKVHERVQLDARHALYIVELDGSERMLLATGEQGVQVLQRLAPRRDFQSALEAGTPGKPLSGGGD
ncbi:MAG: flagellar biosynthetic protein FliO [Deltaproteobacteria bacterium]|nr:flagellar biosynthetic protein FliO [Deltaproteobacteria bacterium]